MTELTRKVVTRCADPERLKQLGTYNYFIDNKDVAVTAFRLLDIVKLKIENLLKIEEVDCDKMKGAMNHETITKMKKEKAVHQEKMKRLVVELLSRDSMSNFERKRKCINEMLQAKIPSYHNFRKDREPVQRFQYKPKENLTDNSFANMAEIVEVLTLIDEDGNLIIGNEYMLVNSSLLDIVDIVPDETSSSWLDQY